MSVEVPADLSRNVSRAEEQPFPKCHQTPLPTFPEMSVPLYILSSSITELTFRKRFPFGAFAPFKSTTYVCSRTVPRGVA